MTVTVGIPFYGKSEHLNRCIASLLRQTYRDMHIVVVLDGCDAIIDSKDTRISVIKLPENKGAYFSRAVALHATRTKHHAVIDADDWVDPWWLETLLSRDSNAVQHGSRYHVVGSSINNRKVRKWNHAHRSLASKLIHYSSHTGLYNTQYLNSVGGYSPAFRVGYDSFLSAILRMVGPVAIVDEPMYYRYRHKDSLCNSKETKIGSQFRLKTRKILEDAYSEAYQYVGQTEKIKQVALKLTPTSMWDEVKFYAEQLSVNA